MRSARRGFTLLEVALAAVLGSMVVLVAISLFASLDTADKVGQEAFDDALAEALAHETFTKAFSDLMMSNTTPPPRNAEGRRVRPSRDVDPDEPEPDEFNGERPRLILQLDEGLPPVMPETDPATGDLMRPQRLEVALRSRPLFVFGVERVESIEELEAIGEGVDPDRPDESELNGGERPGDGAGPGGSRDAAPGGDGERPRSGSELRRQREERRRGSNASGANDGGTGLDGSGNSEGDERPRSARREREAGASSVATELVPGVRGAFEFEYDPGLEAGGFERQPGWVLWWRQIYPVVEPPVDLEPTSTQRVGATRLMGNIASATWHVLYTKKRGANQGGEAERLREHAALWFDDLPGYIELDIRTNSGIRHQWTFEVAWGVSGEPGSLVSVTPPGTNPAAAGGPLSPAGAAGAPDRARTPTGDAGRGGGGGALDRPRRGGSTERPSGGSSSGSNGSRGDQDRRR